MCVKRREEEGEEEEEQEEEEESVYVCPCWRMEQCSEASTGLSGEVMTQLAMKQEDQRRKTDQAEACCHVGPPTVTIAPRKHDMGQMTASR
ncbi:hypothetical protein INR49_022616 [Caranx melampygus]|nr:hypothetical protein INR49_022616 [Caranx melampygus]